MSSTTSDIVTLLNLEKHRSCATMVFLAILVGLCSMDLAQAIVILALLRKVATGVVIDPSYFSALETRGTILQVLSLIIWVLTALLWLAWFHSAYRNLKLMGTGNTAYKPGWAIGWWFIPGYNLFRPLQLTREVWIRSHEVNSRESIEGVRTPPLLAWWWLAWIASQPLRRAAEVMSRDLEEIEDVRAFAIMGSLADCAYLAACVLGFHVVAAIDALQSRALSEPAPATLSTGGEPIQVDATPQPRRRVRSFIPSISATAWFALLILGVGGATTFFEMKQSHSAETTLSDPVDLILFHRSTGEYETALGVARAALAEVEQDTSASAERMRDAEWEVQTLEFITQLDAGARAQMTTADQARLNAWSWFEEENLDSARVAAEAALAPRLQFLGETFPEVAESLEDLAVVLCRLDRYGEAEPYLRKALTMRKQLQGIDHSATQNSVELLVGLLSIQGRDPEAQAIYEDYSSIPNRPESRVPLD